MQLCFLDKKIHLIFIQPNSAASRAEKNPVFQRASQLFQPHSFSPNWPPSPADNAGCAHAEN